MNNTIIDSESIVQIDFADKRPSDKKVGEVENRRIRCESVSILVGFTRMRNDSYVQWRCHAYRRRENHRCQRILEREC
jgi:hypothetical protein